jgi:hypothetical protein
MIFIYYILGQMYRYSDQQPTKRMNMGNKWLKTGIDEVAEFGQFYKMITSIL